jgi:hypothetical protein
MNGIVALGQVWKIAHKGEGIGEQGMFVFATPCAGLEERFVRE